MAGADDSSQKPLACRELPGARIRAKLRRGARRRDCLPLWGGLRVDSTVTNPPARPTYRHYGAGASLCYACSWKKPRAALLSRIN